MNELQKLKSWFTLEEAAQIISDAMSGQEVTVATLLQFALPGGRLGGVDRRHLTLSIDLANPVKGKRGVLTKPENVEAQKKQMLRWGPVSSFVLDGKVVGDPPVLRPFLVMVMDERVKNIQGVWDLAGWGGEDASLQNRLYELIGAPQIEQTAWGKQTWLCSGDQYVQLHEPFPAEAATAGAEGGEPPLIVGPLPEFSATSHYPSTGLPEGALLVVRQKELARFLDNLAKGDASQLASTVTANDGAAAAPTTGPANERTGLVHSTKTRGRDEADVIIDAAIEAAGEQADDAAVWVALQRLVEADILPGTAVGMMAGQGLKYTKSGKSRILSRDALMKRLRRRRSP